MRDIHFAFELKIILEEKEMKKGVLLIVVLLALIGVLTSCEYEHFVNSEEEPQLETDVVELNADNFNEYFYSEIYGNAEVNTSALGSTYFNHSVRISFYLNQTAAIKNVTVNGRLELNVPKTHLLYTKGKLPIEFSVNINGNGHGETTVYFQHGIGSYGGFSMDDYYVVVESATGSILPNLS